MKATRTKQITCKVDIEVLSSKFVTDDCKQGLWQTLHKRCAICRKLFPVGCSISLIMYVENGVQKSGGVHTECLEEAKP